VTTTLRRGTGFGLQDAAREEQVRDAEEVCIMPKLSLFDITQQQEKLKNGNKL
jgi:hypothetical protein